MKMRALLLFTFVAVCASCSGPDAEQTGESGSERQAERPAEESEASTINGQWEGAMAKASIGLTLSGDSAMVSGSGKLTDIQGTSHDVTVTGMAVGDVFALTIYDTDNQESVTFQGKIAGDVMNGELKVIGYDGLPATLHRVNGAQDEAAESHDPWGAGVPVSRAALGEIWPFTVESGVLKCRGTPENTMLVFSTGGTDYAVNGTAGQSYPSSNPLRGRDPESEMPIGNLLALIDATLKLCAENAPGGAQ